MSVLNTNLDAIEACTSLPELRMVFQNIIENYGFSSFGFLDASHPWEENPLLMATHSTDWIETYRRENFLSFDPCLSEARRTNRLFNWGSIKLPPVTGKKKPGAVKTMEAARDFGILEGLTIPVHYQDRLGRRCSSVCALFWKNQLTAFFENFRISGLEIHMTLLYFSQKMVDLYTEELHMESRFAGASSDLIYITDREKEVLCWAGRGKTADETADILSCGRTTVETHVKNVMAKLGATTKTQAVVQAVYRGLIDI
jgi:DNA-binding CsgD family transcriptional regulator